MRSTDASTLLGQQKVRQHVEARRQMCRSPGGTRNTQQGEGGLIAFQLQPYLQYKINLKLDGISQVDNLTYLIQ